MTTGPLTRDATAAALITDPHTLRCIESAYRRGFHQGVGLSYDLVEDLLGSTSARRALGSAERIASEYRSQGKHPGRPPIVDEIRLRILNRRRRRTRKRGA